MNHEIMWMYQNGIIKDNHVFIKWKSFVKTQQIRIQYFSWKVIQ